MPMHFLSWEMLSGWKYRLFHNPCRRCFQVWDSAAIGHGMQAQAFPRKVKFLRLKLLLQKFNIFSIFAPSKTLCVC